MEYLILIYLFYYIVVFYVHKWDASVYLKLIAIEGLL